MPNISLCEDQGSIYYNPFVLETRLVCKYNIPSTSYPTVLRTNYEQNIFKSMEIDGVMLDELVTEYTFDTTGIHTVKYELYDETKLGNNAPVFYNSYLIKAIIPDGVTIIGSNTFVNCQGLTEIIMPSSITSINSASFANCINLISVIIKAITPPILNGSAFDSTNNCIFYVPSNSINIYKAENIWENYRDRIQAIQD